MKNTSSTSTSWLRLAEYGDWPHPRGLQRFTPAAANTMVQYFKSLRGRLARKFGGLPVYIGHPDDAQFCGQSGHTDTRAYAWVTDLDVRRDGLYGAFKWSPAGEELLHNAFYKFLSPRWAMEPLGTDAFAPVRLLSVGLTNQPNIPGEAIANDAAMDADTTPHAAHGPSAPLADATEHTTAYATGTTNTAADTVSHNTSPTHANTSNFADEDNHATTDATDTDSSNTASTAPSNTAATDSGNISGTAPSNTTRTAPSNTASTDSGNTANTDSSSAPNDDTQTSYRQLRAALGISAEIDPMEAIAELREQSERFYRIACEQSDRLVHESASLANAQREQIGLVVQNALLTGRIAPYEAANWQQHFSEDWDGAQAALSARTHSLKTTAIANTRTPAQNATANADSFLARVEAHAKANQLNFAQAWCDLKRRQPDLYQQFFANDD